MKYLVNRKTKEHVKKGLAPLWLDESPDWKVVEADDEGWIPWSGEECPLPDECKCQIELQDGERLLPEPSRRWAWERNIGEFTIAAYRPILSETAEKEEPRRHGRTIAYIPETPANVFDRLKSAIAASESIPAIIAEIDAMLPDGYCVAKREACPAEDMSDWRNWREGDLVECINNEGCSLLGLDGKYKIESKDTDYIYVGTVNDGWTPDRFRFHSRPAKGSV